MVSSWKKAQAWEKDWHGNCVNSLNEEEKQLDYAKRMGLLQVPNHKTPYRFDCQGKSILDVGAGPYSLLLKCFNFSRAMVIDPIKYPDWVYARYKAMGIEYITIKGEDLLDYWKKTPASFGDDIFEETWIYNCLEHVEDPKKIIKNILTISKVVRVFEWLDTPKNTGHPQTLSQKNMDKWLGGEGKTEIITRGGGSGKAYYGVFKGKHYEEKI